MCNLDSSEGREEDLIYSLGLQPSPDNTIFAKGEWNPNKDIKLETLK